MRLILILSLYVFLPSYLLSQTCIISVVKRTNEILVATDSKRSILLKLVGENGIIKDTIFYDSVCKVKNVRNIYFSAAGLDINSAYKTAKKCAEKDTSLEKIVKAFSTQRKAELYSYMEQEKANKTFEVNFRHLVRNQMMFYAIERGIAKMARVDIIMVNKFSQPTILIDTIQWYLRKPDKDRITIIGDIGTADSIIEKAISKRGMEKGLVYSIEQQIKATPKTVGAPVQMFLINKNGFKWLLNPLRCPFNN